MRILTIDVGTTSVKAAVVDDGHIGAVAEVPLDLEHPRPGWAEQDPRQWWSATVTAVRSLHGLDTVDALAATGQMQDCVPVHGTASCSATAR